MERGNVCFKNDIAVVPKHISFYLKENGIM